MGGSAILCRVRVAWRGMLFFTGEIVVLSCVFSISDACGSVRVYTHTHTHTAHGVLDVSPGVETRHLEGPKNLDGLNLDICAFVYVYKVRMCICMLGDGMMSWTNCFLPVKHFSFQKSKAKDMKVKPRTQIQAA